MGSELSLSVAFLAGFVSFLSPCVLPVIPGFIAYLAGDVSTQSSGRITTFIASIFFVAGFISVFAVLGMILTSVLGGATGAIQVWLARIGGIIIIFFGVYLTGLVRIRFLDRPHTISIRHRFSSRQLTAFVFGAAFATGWTPCVGAAVGAILGLAASTPSAAFALLFAYASGLGLPFLVVGVFTNEAVSLATRYGTNTHRIAQVFGGILIVLGFLVFTQQLSLIADFGVTRQCVGHFE